MKVTVDAELEDIFPTYLKNRASDMLELEKALAAENFEQMRHIGHKIVGNAAGYGLEGLSHFSRQLENAAKSKELAMCQKSINDMASYLNSLELVFE